MCNIIHFPWDELIIVILIGNLVTFLYKTITCQTSFLCRSRTWRNVIRICQTTFHQVHLCYGISQKQKPPVLLRGEKWKTENRTYENYNTIFSFVSTNLSITSTKSIKQISWSLVSMTSKFCVNNLTS